MNFIMAIQVGLREILVHKFRSFLTMFGIILGVSSLIAMFATVEGMTRGMKENLLLSGGVERVSLIDQDVPPKQEEIKNLSPGRTLRDVKAIRESCPLVVDISPEVALFEPAVQYSNKFVSSNVYGATPSFFNVNNYEIERGRMLSALDLDTNAQVCVIGWPVWEELEQLRSNDPVGKMIKVNEVSFRIVGVLRDYESEYQRKLRKSGKIAAWEKRAKERRSSQTVGRGVPGGWNYARYKNNRTIIPLSTMQTIYKSAVSKLPTDQPEPDSRLTNLYFKVRDIDLLNEAVEQVRSVVLKVHRGIEDFGFDTREDWAESIESTVRAARLNGGIIAGISLLVGGIGIANIMLASITERVREIGIRMAVGARGKDIFFQILVESSMLGFMGGLIGLSVSFGLVQFISRVAGLNNEPVITLSSMLISFSFSVITGVLAGIYPALRASRLNPIQALRYE